MGRLGFRNEGISASMGLDKQVSTSMGVISSNACTMTASNGADNANDNANMGKLVGSAASGRKMHAGFLITRNASSLSTESSEFEFDACSFSELHDEPPISPKLLNYSPNYTPNYSPNHSPDAKTSPMTSTNQYFADRDSLLASNADYFQHQGSPPVAPFTRTYGAFSLKEKINQEISDANFGLSHGLYSSLSRAKSEGEISGNAQIRRADNHDKQEPRGKFDGISVDNPSGNDNYEAPATGLRANYAAGEGTRRMNLMSLLNRRDLDELPPLTNFNRQSNNDIKKQVPVNRNSAASQSNSASGSPSSSPLNYPANRSTYPSKFEDDHPDYTGDTKSCHKKNRKWAFKLDFLKKSPSPRADPSVNQSISNDKRADYSPYRDGISNQPDDCSTAATADEARFNNYLNHDAAVTAGEPGITNNTQLMQRIEHFRAAAAAGEARFNRQINQSINLNHRAAAGADAAKEIRLNHRINHRSNDKGDQGEGVITKFESPRQSTCSAISSSVSSSPRHELVARNGENEMIKANYRKISKSAPISPAGSPPRSSNAAGGEGAFTRGRAPMSPHALHYEQQKARMGELRRKTFLPYRQSLLGACFFPHTTTPHHPQQAVY